ncbi:hypothetical protein [Dactylosporangium vinaceum]|uniref:Uncharacterized protein n=1 Tax=Dactylosporangium vinaceum TaxID=53362 RepID=A0ABV5MFX3_9ACTN|nr:hypothetical protein [Dactylosporangium vinaceum]
MSARKCERPALVGPAGREPQRAAAGADPALADKCPAMALRPGV